MKQSNISFDKGIHRTPSIGAAGELSDAMNLIPSNGELQNIPQPVSKGSISSGTLLHIHDGRNVVQGNGVITFGSNSLSGTAKFVESIGNVLLIMLSTYEPHYYLYQNNEYKEIGDGTFSLDLMFSVDTEYKEITNTKHISVIADGSNSAQGSYSYYQKANLKFGDDNGTYKPCELVYNLAKGKTYRIRLVYESDIVAWKTVELKKGDTYSYLIEYHNSESTSDTFSFYADDDYTAIRVKFFSVPTQQMQMFVNGTIYLDEAESNSQVTPTGYSFDLSEDNVNRYYGELNSFIKSKYEEDGEFIMPFLLRYAIKLTTGDYAYLSAPILIEPNSGVVPIMRLKDITSSSSKPYYYNATSCTGAFTGKLKMMAANASQLSALTSLSDIVESVVIGITEPIYQYKQNPSATDSTLTLTQEAPSNLSYALGNGAKSKTYDGGFFVLTPKKSTEYETDIVGSSIFHVVKEINISEISSSSFTLLDISGDKLASLSGIKEVIPDNPLVNSSFGADTSISYNSRLTLAGIHENAFEGYSANSLSGCLVETSTNEVSMSVDVTLNGEKYTAVKGKQSNYNYASQRWAYFPNSNASLIRFVYGSQAYEFVLKKHPFLKGSYCFDGHINVLTRGISMDANDSRPSVYYGNRIITSAVNSPLSKEHDNYISCRTINALSTSAKALSQGQFGQFPIYAFSDNGIWALEVSNTGVISTKQPISRDVCTVQKSITQLDNAIAFITKEGVKVISGSEVELISEKVHGLNGDYSFISNVLEGTFQDNNGDNNGENEPDKEPTHDFSGGSEYDYSNSITETDSLKLSRYNTVDVCNVELTENHKYAIGVYSESDYNIYMQITCQSGDPHKSNYPEIEGEGLSYAEFVCLESGVHHITAFNMRFSASYFRFIIYDLGLVENGETPEEPVTPEEPSNPTEYDFAFGSNFNGFIYEFASSVTNKEINPGTKVKILSSSQLKNGKPYVLSLTRTDYSLVIDPIKVYVGNKIVKLIKWNKYKTVYIIFEYFDEGNTDIYIENLSPTGFTVSAAYILTNDESSNMPLAPGEVPPVADDEEGDDEEGDGEEGGGEESTEVIKEEFIPYLEPVNKGYISLVNSSSNFLIYKIDENSSASVKELKVNSVLKCYKASFLNDGNSNFAIVMNIRYIEYEGDEAIWTLRFINRGSVVRTIKYRVSTYQTNNSDLVIPVDYLTVYGNSDDSNFVADNTYGMEIIAPSTGTTSTCFFINNLKLIRVSNFIENYPASGEYLSYMSSNAENTINNRIEMYGSSRRILNEDIMDLIEIHSYMKDLLFISISGQSGTKIIRLEAISSNGYSYYIYTKINVNGANYYPIDLNILPTGFYRIYLSFVDYPALDFVVNYDIYSLQTSVKPKPARRKNEAKRVLKYGYSITFPDLLKTDGMPFNVLIQNEGTRLCYDYVNQLIHVFVKNKNTDESYLDWHYVYSRKTNEWSKQLNNGNFITVVPGYPLSIIQYDEALVSYTHITREENNKGFALTRSYAFDDPFTAKMLYDLKLFGQRHSDSMYKVVVYISNDNINWYVLNSLKGRSAKFYRFLILTNMYDTDTLTGMTLLYQERYSHKLR